ncbi:unconventional myosin-VI-like [Oscarella lobularis]|uniref:unconventional myosin-VI-like n=1 Tax=Oscarella lobularis TaxID=121494 RepID=UPI0033140CC0
MDEGRKIWAPDNVHGFVLGTISDLGVDTITIQPLNGQDAIAAPYDSVFPAADDSLGDVDDNCKLMYLNEATLLENVRVRYSKDKIYTYTANILIAVNPYHDMGTLYSSSQVAKYKGQSLGTLPPHVFAIADKAYRDIRNLRQSQSIVVSGESGAGKTESTKYIIRYLTEAWGTGAGAIEQRLNEANPVLEAFGNARTIRNHNSSRFGKFVEIHFDAEDKVVGGFVSHYLLEKSRVCAQLRGERNYHIFYQLCAGASAETRKKLHLAAAEGSKYLNKEGVIADPLTNDVKAFQIVQGALEKIGVSESDKMKMFRVVAAVLHLGNVQFAADTSNPKGGSFVQPQSKDSVDVIAELLGLESSDLEAALTGRIMTPGKAGGKGTVYRISLKLHEAVAACDAFAKALYVSLFDHVVEKVNQGFSFKESSTYIGILDIAGFEFYQTNGYEQFCINYCNEKLQQFFNNRVLKEEQELYVKEGLDVEVVTFADNQDCIDLIEAKSVGIIDLLDEESRLPQSSDMHFCQVLHDKHKKHFRLAFPRDTKFAVTKSMRDDEGFVVRHFAGAVCYKAAGFIDKNNDALHENLEILMIDSKEAFVKSIFESYLKKQEATSPQSKRKSGGRKLALVSIGSKFKSQLADLMGKLKSTGASFVRCIKPNLKNAPSTFMGGEVLSQLHSAGMMSVLDLMDDGYPTRTPFHGLHELYKNRVPSTLTSLDAKSFCEALFKTVGMHESDYKFGETSVFFRPGKFAEFDQIVEPDSGRRTALVSKTVLWFVKARWRKAQYAVLSIIKLMKKIQYRANSRIVIQKTAKMYLAKKKHQQRFKIASKLKMLLERLTFMRTLVQSLNKSSQERLLATIETYENGVNSMLTKVKSTEMNRIVLQAKYKELLAKVHSLLETLETAQKQQKVEASNATAMRVAFEAEKQSREEMELRERQEDEARKEKAEMEARRKKEEEEARKQQALLEQEKAAKALQEKLIAEEEAKKMKITEQERRDHELALRLAQESGDQSVAAKSTRQSLRRSVLVTEKQEARAQQKHDLSQWKYAELRDVINTSCDIELLEACRAEFHRRLKVYHAWKLKNKKNVDAATSKGEEDHKRAPDAIIETAKLSSPPEAAPKKPQEVQPAEVPQRYFRVPFVRPSQKGQPGQSKGWWYAHFDGNWIARQIDMYPGKKPVLLVAGKNDIDMCELSLTETGLTRKKGAEILPQQFEEQWSRLGGPQYSRPANRKK